MLVTAETYISDVMLLKKGAVRFLINCGSHCPECDFANTRTLADLSQEHNLDLENLLDRLNQLPDA